MLYGDGDQIKKFLPGLVAKYQVDLGIQDDILFFKGTYEDIKRCRKDIFLLLSSFVASSELLKSSTPPGTPSRRIGTPPRKLSPSERVSRRLKQIKIGKDSVGYKNYVKLIPNKRNEKEMIQRLLIIMRVWVNVVLTD
eukprot:UN23866